MKKVKEVGKSRTKIHVGDIFDTNNCGKLRVIEYRGSLDVIVKFEDTGYETTTQANQLRKGEVKDRSLPSVYGVGIIGNVITRVCGVETKDRKLWNSMLERCYDEKLHAYRPTYKDCHVSEEWRYLSKFKDWCNNQIGFGLEGWHLDKDILVKGNKIYSEDRCCFVPAEINSLFTKSDRSRGEYPIGVQYHKPGKCFRAYVWCYGKQVYLGQFTTEIEAFNSYKQAKEDYIKEVANKWKDQIDPRVYEALMKYRVEITD